ncbi:MAG: hypothetical protein M1814_004569 [Vezdaea aestivalis]|nr:MAG: hypothetical protein M1814_004569 [Vezdaea aestivalis]
MSSHVTSTTTSPPPATMGQSKNSPTTKQSSKMHRRSRSGCFTCRLRRKKCDEGKPACKACRHLGLCCEYKRPMWWGNNEHRRMQKEKIKSIIKNTKVSEKNTQAMGADTPPELSYSLPTSDTYSDTTDRTRSVSIDSHHDFEFDFNTTEPFNAFSMPMQYGLGYHHSLPGYEVDVKTERQTYINDVPTRRDSSISTFSTFQPPPAALPAFQPYTTHDSWAQEEPVDGHRSSYSTAEEGLDFNYFDFSHGQQSNNQQAVIHVDENDRRLLDHFIENVLPMIFPILEVNQHGSARTDIILPALETNKCYLHCCLSIAALHLKTQGVDNEQINSDIMRHRYATVSELCEALARDTDHQQILEATLGMIFFQCSVGRPEDCLPDIPWHSHFQAVVSLVHKLELPRALTDITTTSTFKPPFNMTLAAWIDILGSSMLGRTPQFADTYKDKHLSQSSSGLCELMGCDDRVMYIISEIASLEAIKNEGTFDDIIICRYIQALGDRIRTLECNSQGLETSEVALAYSPTGALRPKQLARNMSATFRLAARIYLCTLVPDFDRTQAQIIDLVDKMAETLEYVPSGPEGFDRSLVWPLLMAGAVSTPHSHFRSVFATRCASLGDHASLGSFGRMRRLLHEVWQRADSAPHGAPHVHWRDVMQQNGWDFLLI